VFLIDDKNKEFNPATKKAFDVNDVQMLGDYVAKNYTPEEKAKLKTPKFFYEVEFEKLGGMIMPIIVELQFEDGSVEKSTFPPQIWRKNNETAKRVFATDKKIIKIQLDSKLETADIDTSNNVWPQVEAPSKFDQLIKK